MKYLLTVIFLMGFYAALHAQKPLLVLPVGHTTEVWSARFTLDGKKIMTISYDDDGIKIWEASSGKLLQSINTDGMMNLHDPEIIGNTIKVYTTIDNSEHSWDLRTGQKIPAVIKKDDGKKSNPYENDNAVFSGDHTLAAVVKEHNKVEIIDVAANKVISNFRVKTSGDEEELPEFYFNFSRNKKLLIVGDQSDSVWVWNIAQNKMVNRIECKYNIKSADLSEDAKRLVLFCDGPDSDKKDASNDLILVWDLSKVKLFKSTLFEDVFIHSAEISPDGQQLALSMDDNKAGVWDIEEGRFLNKMEGHAKEITFFDFSADGKLGIACQSDSIAKLWDIEKGQVIGRLPLESDAIDVHFSPDNKKVLTIGHTSGKVDIWDIPTGKKLDRFLTIDSTKNLLFAARFSKDGANLVTAESAPLNKKTFYVNTWQISSHTLLHHTKIELDKFDDSYTCISNDGSAVICLVDTVVHVFDVLTGKPTKTYHIPPSSTKLGDLEYKENFRLSFDNAKLMARMVSGDNTIYDLITGRIIQNINTSSSFFSSAYNPQTKKIVSLSGAEMRMYTKKDEPMINLDNETPILTFYAIDSTDWAVIHSSGLFDASPGAMEKMYWVMGDEIIEFNQLKDRYWQPGLAKNIADGKPLRSVEGMDNFKLQPLVTLGEMKDGILSLQLQKRTGGYGKITILINNKEVLEDARPAGFNASLPTQTILVNLKPFLKEGIQQAISVKAQTEDGFVTGRGVVKMVPVAKTTLAPRKPAFYAVVCGTGEFGNKSLNLKYSVPDAEAITKAITLGANNLFGKDSTHIYQLSSPGNRPTTKRNIQEVFAEIKTKAKPEDIVLVYLSGHGMAYGGDKGDFYYLTTEYSGASAESFSDPALRTNQAVSTEEFTKWLNEIPALKQVMIIDACGSGKAVDNLLAKKDIEASQIKAIDRMKDRTGLYIISGCASDAVSYEASKYGQGLLTYSVLQAIKGAALKENRFIDINMLLSFSREEVPRLAANIGGIQQPQLLIPKGGSFDIGIIKEEEKSLIPLAASKPIFKRTNFIEKESLTDGENITGLLNNQLQEISGTMVNNKSIIFLDVNNFPDACSVSGLYTIANKKIRLEGVFSCGETKKKFTLENETKESLIGKLTAMVLEGVQ